MPPAEAASNKRKVREYDQPPHELTTDPVQHCDFHRLPVDCLLVLWSTLSRSDYLKTIRTCRKWYQQACGPKLPPWPLVQNSEHKYAWCSLQQLHREASYTWRAPSLDLLLRLLTTRAVHSHVLSLDVLPRPLGSSPCTWDWWSTELHSDRPIPGIRIPSAVQLQLAERLTHLIKLQIPVCFAAADYNHMACTPLRLPLPPCLRELVLRLSLLDAKPRSRGWDWYDLDGRDTEWMDDEEDDIRENEALESDSFIPAHGWLCLAQLLESMAGAQLRTLHLLWSKDPIGQAFRRGNVFERPYTFGTSAGIMPTNVLVALRQFPRLSTFSLMGIEEFADMPASHLSNFGPEHLPTLTDLRIGHGRISPLQLQALTAAVQLHSIAFDHLTLTPQYTSSLVHFLHLTSLQPRAWSQFRTSKDAHFLQRLAQLRQVRMLCDRTVRARKLLAALVSCTNLTELEFGHGAATDKDLSHLLSKSPALRRLHLRNMHELDTVHALLLHAEVHRPHGLQQLTLDECCYIPPSELKSLRMLPTLQHLTIHVSEWPEEAQFHSTSERKALVDFCTWLPGRGAHHSIEWPHLQRAQCHFPERPA